MRDDPSVAPSTNNAAPGAPSSANDRATTFQAVPGGQEHYSGETLLVSAYALLWVLLIGWVALMWRKQSELRARLSDLERVLGKAAAERPASREASR
jgi:hypothetical protein